MKTLFSTTTAALLAIAASTAHAQASGPSDAEIAGIVVAANTVDVEAGKLAESTSKSDDVKAFAHRMVVDHSGVNQQAGDLVAGLKITPAESDISKSLTQGGAATRDKLKALKGKAFDTAYVDNEVAYHQTVLDALDKTLIPNAKNDELKGLLVKVRPAFVAHLEHAKHIRSSLK